MSTPHQPRIRLLNVPIDNGTIASALDDIAAQIASGSGPAQFAFVNADCLNRAWKHLEYRELLGRLPRVFADGSGIRWAMRLLHHIDLAGNVNGTDLFPLLCEQAQANGWQIGLIGATAEVMGRLVTNLSARYPDLNVSYARDGFFSVAEEPSVVEAIAAVRPDVLLVGMGAPRQEIWIHEHLDQLNARVAIGVGGLFDFYSDRIPRAPMLIRRMGMEWVWRLAHEPTRLWRRYLVGNPVFLWRALANRKRDRALIVAGAAG